MMSRCFGLILLVTVPTVSAGGAGCAGNSEGDRIRSITVFPVSLAGDPAPNVGDALGLLLEQEGVPVVASSHVLFAPTPATKLPQVAEQFAAFVKAQKIDTDHALYAEFVGSPKTGVKEVRTVVVDRAGAVLVADQQTPNDADFARVKPRNPMTCCVLVKTRLAGRLDTSARGRKDGPMAALWDEASGMPPRAELRAIRERGRALRAKDRPLHVSLLGLRVDTASDAQGAARLAEIVSAARAWRMAPAAELVDLPAVRSSNEQRVLWTLATALRDYVRAAKPDVDYIAYAHYIIRPDDDKVFGVHFVMCDRAGEWVVVDFQNEYQSDFQAINPQSVEECHRLVARRLARFVD